MPRCRSETQRSPASGQNSAPVVAWRNEKPINRWLDILLLAERLAPQPSLLPAHYTGFVSTDNRFYKPIRDAGLATGKLAPRQ